MTRTLAFPAHPVGTVYVAAEDSRYELPAQGVVEIPEGARTFLVLDDAASADLSFLEGFDQDVLSGANLAHVSSQGLALLALQTSVQQLAVGELDDAGIGRLAALRGLQVLDVTLVGESGPGLETLASSDLMSLQLHGEPGAALTPLGRSTTLRELHFHAPDLGAHQLRTLATSTPLEYLDIEVQQVLDLADQDAVSTLVAVASGLQALTVSRADGSSGLSPAVQMEVLRACEGLTLNGVDYTPAAMARMERKLAPA